MRVNPDTSWPEGGRMIALAVVASWTIIAVLVRAFT